MGLGLGLGLGVRAHVRVGLKRSARHPLAVHVRAALPLDIELLRKWFRCTC